MRSLFLAVCFFAFAEGVALATSAPSFIVFFASGRAEISEQGARVMPFEMQPMMAGRQANPAPVEPGAVSVNGDVTIKTSAAVAMTFPPTRRAMSTNGGMVDIEKIVDSERTALSPEPNAFIQTWSNR